MEICTRFQRTKAYAHQYHLTKLSWKFRRIQAILSGCSFIFNTCLNLQTMKTMEISEQFHRTIAYAHQEHKRKLSWKFGRIPTILSGVTVGSVVVVAGRRRKNSLLTIYIGKGQKQRKSAKKLANLGFKHKSLSSQSAILPLGHLDILKNRGNTYLNVKLSS